MRPSVDEETDDVEIPGVGLKPEGKCEHGVYIAAGDYTARYCSACNPQPADRMLAKAMARSKPASRTYVDPPVLDAAEFMAQPAGARLAEMEALL